MTGAVAEASDVKPAGLLSGRSWSLVCGLFIFGAVLLFAYDGLRYVHETEQQVRLIPWLTYDNRVDFGYFYAGADMAWHGEAADLYPVKGELTFYPGDPIFQRNRTEYGKARILARGNYYNPPALAFLQAPLTRLPFRYAFWLFSFLSFTTLAGYALLAWRAGRKIPGRRDA